MAAVGSPPHVDSSFCVRVSWPSLRLRGVRSQCVRRWRFANPHTLSVKATRFQHNHDDLTNHVDDDDHADDNFCTGRDYDYATNHNAHDNNFCGYARRNVNDQDDNNHERGNDHDGGTAHHTEQRQPDSC